MTPSAHATHRLTEETLLEYSTRDASAPVRLMYQGYKDGRRGLRNAQDHARDCSYALKDQLKEHWEQHRNLRPIPEGAPLLIPDDTCEETKADEDEAGYGVVEQSGQPTPGASLPLANDYAASSGGHNRKASSPHPGEGARGKTTRH